MDETEEYCRPVFLANLKALMALPDQAAEDLAGVPVRTVSLEGILPAKQSAQPKALL